MHPSSQWIITKFKEWTTSQRRNEISEINKIMIETIV